MVAAPTLRHNKSVKQEQSLKISGSSALMMKTTSKTLQKQSLSSDVFKVKLELYEATRHYRRLYAVYTDQSWVDISRWSHPD